MGWQKGQSGNPHGRKPGEKALTEVLRAYLAAKDEEDGITRRENLAAKLYSMAIAGDVDALRYCYDRCDGKPTEAIEHSGKDGEDIALTIREVIVHRTEREVGEG